MKTELRYAQKAIIFDKNTNSILLIRYKSSKFLDSKITNKLGLPGGQINFGEDLDASIIREVQEETGVLIKPLFPIKTWSWTYQKEGTLKQIIAASRYCKYVSSEITEPTQEAETTLFKAEWYKLNDVNLDELVYDEIPSIKTFIKLLKNKVI